ncbi:MAG TPA: hypothetical protein DCZ94_13800 [Lentisphaeria bacterium]|nr:MAG: hypothetical protein A2X48_15685 [Lentisphaerae bacterium GWF2_49_21]HBC88020.1 hypothetical protein [Lentisphaeria bacterium]
MCNKQNPQQENFIGEITSLATVSASELVTVLGVVYVHRKTSDGGDIYLTQFGLAHAKLLDVENWYARDWFETYREKLEGTSAVYRVPTKTVDGCHLDLVVKNSRVGEDVPLETHTLMEFINAEFNSPWEEFSLVMEMREGKYGPQDRNVRTQEPLAIYVPPERMQVWQSGRSLEKINRIHARHPGIELDILRQYKLIYAWIPGQNIVEILEKVGIAGADLQTHLEPLTKHAIRDLEQKGFVMADMKPVHLIVRADDEAGVFECTGVSDEERIRAQAANLRELLEKGRYSVVDYELVLRTPKYEKEVARARRHRYLDDQRDRFKPTHLPQHLMQMEILGVPYVYGRVESTGGELWVVGRNGHLFDYFLPERWRREPFWRLSQRSEVFYTLTKDHVHLVWKTSKMGERAGDSSDVSVSDAVLKYGYNSPFEEFAIARELADHGLPAVYVRAVYMTRGRGLTPDLDNRHYLQLNHLKTPVGEPLLREDRDYITLRGYYNGLDEWVAEQESGPLLKPVDAETAISIGRLPAEQVEDVIAELKSRMLAYGYDGSCLARNDFILSENADGQLEKDKEGVVIARIANFELIRKIK